MPSNAILRATEALRAAENAVQALQGDIEARDALIEMSHVPEIIAHLVKVTRRRPQWQLGHLSVEDFEVVRALLDAKVELRDHGNGSRYLIISEERCGLVIQAQTSAPSEDAQTSAAEQSA